MRSVEAGRAERVARYQAAAHEEAVGALAEELGVGCEALRALGVGLDDRAQPCFPEVDAAGRIVGVASRDPSRNPKYTVGKGVYRGLILPKSLDSLPDPILMVEGPTDVTAALTMGLTAVGRPCASAGGAMLAERLRGRECIVCGENDRKPDGKWPGRDGAIKIANELRAAWGHDVPVAFPPETIKDVRAFLQAYDDPAAAGADLLQHLRATATTPPPAGSVGLGSTTGGVSKVPWPEPEPIPDGLPEVAAFDLDLLPTAFHDWVADLAERT